MHWLKSVLSYVLPIKIDEAKSDFGFRLELFIKNNQLQLQTPQAIYSYGTSYLAVAWPFRDMQLHLQPIKSVLLLGLGMGSAIDILLLHFPKNNLTIDAIEADSGVLHLYKKYKELTSNTVLYHAEATVYVADNRYKKKYDFIVSDVFVDATIPEACLDVTYLKNTYDLVENKGVLMVNYLNNSLHRAAMSKAVAYCLQAGIIYKELRYESNCIMLLYR